VKYSYIIQKKRAQSNTFVTRKSQLEIDDLYKTLKVNNVNRKIFFYYCEQQFMVKLKFFLKMIEAKGKK